MTEKKFKQYENYGVTERLPGESVKDYMIRHNVHPSCPNCKKERPEDIIDITDQVLERGYIIEVNNKTNEDEARPWKLGIKEDAWEKAIEKMIERGLSREDAEEEYEAELRVEDIQSVLPKIIWYDGEIQEIVDAMKVDVEHAKVILCGKISAIMKAKNCKIREAVVVYGRELCNEAEKKIAVEYIMKEKGVSREVAESEYDFFT